MGEGLLPVLIDWFAEFHFVKVVQNLNLLYSPHFRYDGLLSIYYEVNNSVKER